MQLANEDILRINEVVKEPLEKCLLYLSYKADKVKLEELVNKDMMKKMKY
jgi:hypothetical protein